LETYSIARYYFNSLFKKEAEDNFLEDMQAEPMLSAGRYSYAIGHVQADEIDDVPIIRGQIGRIPVGREGFVYDSKEKDFIVSKHRDFADIILEFCVIPSKHILLIQQHSYFKPETAINKFIDIYLQSNKSYVSSFSIDFLTETKDVYEEINQWTRFTRVKFSGLRPSNPDPNDDYKGIEDMLKELQADQVKIEASVNPPTKKEIELKTPPKTINADSFIVKESLALSSHGYGKAELEGIDEQGNLKTVKTYTYRKTVQIDFQDDGSVAKIKHIVEGAPEEDGKDRASKV
jgi:hypothetical protein